MHLDAVEHNDRIVFMHAVEEGPANQSYGIQVAALAGIPSVVVVRARKQLREFEQRAAVDPAPAGPLRPGRASKRQSPSCIRSSNNWPPSTRTA